jgi:transcriptional regulator with XRE-family HTH domain
MIKGVNFLKVQNEIQSMIGDVRRAKKMTQEELGQIVSLKTKSISDIETNRRKASALTLIKILYALDIDIKKVLGIK